MMKKAKLLTLLGLIGLLLASSVCSKGKRESSQGEMSDLPLGRVAGKDFTVADLEKKLKYQFGSQLVDLTGAQAAAQYRDILVSALDELCWNELGESKGYMKDPAFVDTWELSRRYILARRTVDMEVRAHAEPTDEEIQAFYEENPDEYVIPTRIQIAHVQVATKREAEQVARRLKQGDSIDRVASEVSIDERTRSEGGTLGWITETSSAAHLGRVQEINDAAMKMQKGDVSAPIQLPKDKGWTVLYALDRSEKGPRPLDDTLKEAIRDRVKTQKHNKLFTSLLSELKEEYGYTVYEENYDRYAASLLSEQELFTMAQREKLSDRKIEGYRRVLKYYPTSRYASQAQFMIAFVMADEEHDYDQARVEFEKFLNDYPDHELAESARWMLENMGESDSDSDELKEVRKKAYSTH